ncbi:hypothetical protein [Gordonia sp. (in: high G+C Gram-positive bacteria)]|uniref:hypothetical protein n=1 Tax=Gordonia sp. (in: high G+C Gram-positive bacteria) TaxID=84139 RepID=UPI003C7946D2
MSDPSLNPHRVDKSLASIVDGEAANGNLEEEAVDLQATKPARSGRVRAQGKKSTNTEVSSTKPAASREAKEADKPVEPLSGGALASRTVSIKALLTGAAILAVGVLIAALSWTVVSKSSEIDDMKAARADTAHAEQVALDYATGAADMSYEDTQGWLKRLTANTTPELGTRLRNAAGQMEQLLRPLQWSSTSSPISAKVTSVDGDVYKVDSFVGIVTKNVQAPAAGVETTATYKLTIDKAQDWKITAITSNGTNLDANGATPADGTSGTTGTPQQSQAPAPNNGDVPATPGN